MNSNKRLSTKYTGIDKDIENLTANNMKDLQDRFSNIFKGDFPEDIRDLENIIVSAFVKKLYQKTFGISWISQKKL